jgi:hypothetical protein
MPWAERRPGGRGFDFCEETRVQAGDAVRADLDGDGAEVCILDEIGWLEAEGGGFADLFRHVLASRVRVVIAAVRKDRLGEVTRSFGVGGAEVLDLDTMPLARALRIARRRVAASDADRIGLFAGVSGLVEVGLGSTLHAWRVPFKGHSLAYLQNLLLVTFGKALRGRGLVRISLLGAMLKAFSPMGARFRPMAYIFVQGACFAAPVRLLGWNLLSVLTGSILMGWLTLGLSLAVDYVTFGSSIFDAFAGVIEKVSGWIGFRAPSLFAVICGAFVLKGLLALAVGAGAWWGNMDGLVGRLRRGAAERRRRRGITLRADPRPRSIAGHALAALRDLARPRFAIGFCVSVLLLLFFANLPASDLVSVLVRGLCISWFGLVVARRIDFLSLGQWLDRRVGMDLGRSLPVALGVLSRDRPDTGGAEAPAPSPGATLTPPGAESTLSGGESNERSVE